MISTVLIVLVAAIHIYILILEMFLWDTRIGRKAFNLSADFSYATKTLAGNQGLYNGFLAAGLLYGVWAGEHGFEFKIFFFGLCAYRRDLWGDNRQQKDIVCAGTSRITGTYGTAFSVNSSANPIVDEWDLHSSSIVPIPPEQRCDDDNIQYHTDKKISFKRLFFRFMPK